MANEPNEILAAVTAAVAARKSECPACCGQGILTDDPQVLKCLRCGGIFTPAGERITTIQATQFVAFQLGMLANAGPDGQFYFDFVLQNAGMQPERVHGWADRKTRRVVQWG